MWNRRKAQKSLVPLAESMKDIKDWICHNKSVLVGLSIDEQKQRLPISIISEAGIISKICKISDTGPKSSRGILSRMQNIMMGIKKARQSHFTSSQRMRMSRGGREC